MDLNTQRNISEKIKEAVKSGDSKAIAEEIGKCTEMYVESVSQAITGFTNYTTSSALAALKIVEKSIIKLFASPADIQIAEYFQRTAILLVVQ